VVPASGFDSLVSVCNYSASGSEARVVVLAAPVEVCSLLVWSNKRILTPRILFPMLLTLSLQTPYLKNGIPSLWARAGCQPFFWVSGFHFWLRAQSSRNHRTSWAEDRVKQRKRRNCALASSLTLDYYYLDYLDYYFQVDTLDHHFYTPIGAQKCIYDYKIKGSLGAVESPVPGPVTKYGEQRWARRSLLCFFPVSLAGYWDRSKPEA